MSSDKLNFSVDLVLCMAIKDYSVEEGISEEEARNRIMSSEVVSLLYDTDNRLWTEGPDEIIRLYKELKSDDRTE